MDNHITIQADQCGSGHWRYTLVGTPEPWNDAITRHERLDSVRVRNIQGGGPRGRYYMVRSADDPKYSYLLHSNRKERC
jgi:hypothetical protein